MKKSYIIGTLAAEFRHKTIASRAFLSAMAEWDSVIPLHRKLKYAWEFIKNNYGTDNTDRVFYHEAGHALVAHTLGHKIGYMCARPSFKWGGYVHLEPRPCETYKDVVERIAISHGGVQGENAVFGNHSPMDYAGSDADRSLQMAHLFARGNQQVSAEIISSAGSLAYKAIQDNVPALHALADRLKTKTIITGSEIVDIIDAARAQTSAKPASPSL